jgi:hypothetical protein
MWTESETAMVFTDALTQIKPLLPGALAEYIP